MSIQLTSKEIEQVHALSALLLSPLEYADRREWLDRVNDGLVALTDAERALSAVPMRDPGSVVLRNIDPEVIPAFLAGPVGDDPAVALVTALRPDVICQLMVYGDDLEEQPVFAEVLQPWGIVNSAAMNVYLPDGGLAVASVMTGTEVDRAFQYRAYQLLKLLHPSFLVGVDVLMRVGLGGDALGRMLDEVDEPLLLCDGTGSWVHANRRLREVVAAEPAAPTFRAAMLEAARELAAAAQDADTALAGHGVAEHATERQRYRITSSLVGERLLGNEPGVLVRIQPLDPSTTVRDVGRTRFGLTEREAEVATHVVRGATDREIADALGISWHTVRTHVERVLAKLEVDSRHKVARTLGAAR